MIPLKTITNKQPLSETVKSKGGGKLSVYDATPEERATSVNKTVKAWKDLSMDRLGNIRRNRELYPIDREAVDNYKEVLSMFQVFEDNGQSKKIRILKDETGITQGICSFTVKENSIYVNQLFTAPWNLKMHASNEENYEGLVTRGVGTILLADCYTEAQQKGLKRLELTPLGTSSSYYTDVIGMEKSEKDEILYYSVTDIGKPEKLSAQLARV